MIFYDENKSEEGGYILKIKGNKADLLFEAAFILKNIFEQMKNNGATEEDIVLAACAVQNFALGKIPEK